MIRDWSGGVLVPDLDAAGDPVLTSCGCDEGRTCNFPPCVKRAAEEEAYWSAYFSRVAEEREWAESLVADSDRLIEAVDFYLDAARADA